MENKNLVPVFDLDGKVIGYREVDINTKPLVQQYKQSTSAGVAAILGLLIPGAGQMYRGHVFSGFCWLGLVIAGYMFFLLPGLVLHGMSILFALGSEAV